jgi:xanthine phosphoribosyltransferase
LIQPEIFYHELFGGKIGLSDSSQRYHKTFSISWDRLQNDCRALSRKLLAVRKDWSRIVAIARGGLAPAAIIARELNIRVVDTVCISSYTLRNRSDTLSILKRPDLAEMSPSWLVIDDLVDTGRTANAVREMFPDIHFATVYAKPEGRPIVDTFIAEVSQDTWILFPWDSFATTEFIAPIADTLPG